MATPSVSVSTSVNESTKTIHYTISYSVDYDPEPNEANYHRGETGYRYVNKQSDGSTSYQTEYDNGQSSKTITISYTWESRAIKREETGRSTVGNFSTEAEAQDYINSRSYPEDYTIISATPVVWSVAKLTYAYSVYTSGGLQSGTASATAYFTPKPQTSSPSYTVSRTLTTATASISNLSIDDNVEFTISLHANNLYIASTSDTATGSTMTLSVGGLVRDTKYSALVTVNGKSLGYQNLEPLSPDFNISYTATSATATVINLIEGENVEFGLSEGAGGTNAQSTSGTASGESLSLSISGLTPSTYYTCYVKVNNVNIKNDEFTTLDASQIEDFEWDTDIRAGVKMNTYQYAGTYYPAPVTAAEWNRLIDLIKSKRGISIDYVSSGVHMSAKPGGNIRKVADALGVTINSGDRITAQFFLDLQDAINNK